ncbi:MAG: hypothetical protein R3331_03540 [Sulfurospirillaceae bacterium]|nr:hypothetical protein [Sulfurospirillaceae bacterium]
MMFKRNIPKNGIALLVTVLFIMLITFSIGIGLKYVSTSATNMKSEHFLFQSSILLDDILKILKSSKDLEQINSPGSLALFLTRSSLISFESSGIKIAISIESARSKINPNVLSNEARINAFKSFLAKNTVNLGYADMLLDLQGGMKENMSYNTNIFNDNPELFRDYITSYEHLEALGDIYMKKYHDDNLKNINMKELFYIGVEKNSYIDLNYATLPVWEFILGCDKNRASALVAGEGTYRTLKDLALNSEEASLLKRFKTSFFEPYLDVKVKITQESNSANIRFEYNIRSKKVSNCVFKI